MAYVSGHGPLKPDKSLIMVAWGRTWTWKKGKAAARQVGLAILATLRSELGSLDRVRRVIKVLGMVNCTPDFGQHPAGDQRLQRVVRGGVRAGRGGGSRSAVGMGSLPGNITVEIEAIFEIQ